MAVLTLAPGRAAGPDDLSPALLLIDTKLSGRHLAALWAACGRLRFLPESLTVGIITPVHKKGDAHLPQNYRPISILNVARRVISAAVDSRIRHYLTFHACKWEFWRKVGTEHAISHLISRRKNGYCHVAILDMKAAYDVAPRARILQLVRERLVPDVSGMVASLLTPGQVHVTGAREHCLNVSSGFTQGDPPSLTLFNILMDAFLSEVDQRLGSNMRPASCYSDYMITMARTRHDLQAALNVATAWASRNGMTWNVSKSMELFPLNSPLNHPLQLADQNLQMSHKATYLGVEVTWDGISPDVVLQRIKSASNRLGCLSRSSRIANLQYSSRRFIAMTYVVFMVDYALHLCTLPTSVHSAAAQLERHICRFILNTRVASHATLLARALARLPPIGIRRKAIAFRRSYAARLAIHDYNHGSLQHKRSTTLLSNYVLREASTGGPCPPAKSQNHLRESIDALYITEWKPARHGARPIPSTSQHLPAYKSCPAGLQHVVSRYYLKNIPGEEWAALHKRTAQLPRISSK